jgi:dipeptidyl aminopeptidase/acylaminoacyl peptidase
LDVQITSEEELNGVTIQNIQFAGANGKPVTALLTVPPGEGPFAGMLYLHWGQGDKGEFRSEAIEMASHGVVSLLMDAYWHRPGYGALTGDEEIISIIIDLRRGVDLLQARSDVDPGRIGFVGHSYGAGRGGILAGVEKRIKTFVLMAGWAFPSRYDTIGSSFSLDGFHYIGQAAPSSVLFQFVHVDQYITQDMADEYYAAASQPKEIRWYNGNHSFTSRSARDDRINWLVEQLDLNAPSSLQPFSASGGGVIAFTSDRSGRPGIYVMNADGSDQRLVTDEEDSSSPAFSPGGERIAFGTSGPSMGRIATINVDGSERQNVISRNRSIGDPDWSPDGTQIVFVYHDHIYFSISVIDINGDNFRQLTHPGQYSQINDNPTWSPDGRRIVFSSDRNGNNEIYMMDADGSHVQQLTDNDFIDYWPAWSPDGLQIAFTSHRDGNWDIYVMDVNGSNVRRLTDNPAKDWKAAWSPDGARIAFASERDGNWEIYTMNVDGSHPQRLTNNEAQDLDPTWRPY